MRVLTLSLIPKSSAHVSRAARSCWSSSWSCEQFIDLYSKQSSANNLSFDVTLRKIIYVAQKSKRPRTLPCCTPESTEHGLEDSPSTITCWFLCTMKDWIHLLILPVIPHLLSLNKSFLWGTVSNALLKCNITKSVWSQCFALYHVLLKLVGFHLSGCCKIHAAMGIRLFSRCLSMCFQIMCSNVLQHTLVRDIGR